MIIRVDFKKKHALIHSIFVLKTTITKKKINVTAEQVKNK